MKHGHFWLLNALVVVAVAVAVAVAVVDVKEVDAYIKGQNWSILFLAKKKWFYKRMFDLNGHDRQKNREISSFWKLNQIEKALEIPFNCITV